MSKFTLVSLLLKQFLPTGLDQFVILIYSIVPAQKPKSGEIMFNSPCGHILRFVLKPKCKKFFNPYDQKIYSFEREVYHRKYRKYEDEGYEPNFVEVNKEMENFEPSVTCKDCDRNWDFNFSFNKISNLPLMCFCGKNCSHVSM